MDPTVPVVGPSLAICQICLQSKLLPSCDINGCFAQSSASSESKQDCRSIISFLIAASETHHIYNESYLWHVSQVKGWAGLCNQAQQQQFCTDRWGRLWGGVRERFKRQARHTTLEVKLKNLSQRCYVPKVIYIKVMVPFIMLWIELV